MACLPDVTVNFKDLIISLLDVVIKQMKPRSKISERAKKIEHGND